MKFLLVECISEDEYEIKKIYDDYQNALKDQKLLDKSYIFPVNNHETYYSEYDLADLLNSVYRRLANYFKYDFETFMGIRKIECMSSKNIVTTKFIDKFKLSASQYGRLEEMIWGRKLNTATVYNRVRRYRQIIEDPSHVEKTILIIIKPYI